MKRKGWIERGAAKAAGEKHYFTGRACAQGHVSLRFTSNGKCWACLDDRRRAWRENNRARERAANAARKKINPERVRKDSALYRIRYLDRVRAKQAARRAANPEAARAKARIWAAANPEKMRAKYANRRARKKSASETHSASDVKEILAAQRGKCAYCKVFLGTRFHVDHITPLALGGVNGRRNLQITCPPCNQRKFKKDPVRFAQELGLLI